MTTLREAAQQALELCDRINDEREIWGQHELRAVCERLRAALAEPAVPSDCTDSHQPVQEPVAVVGGHRKGWFYLEGRPNVKIGDRLYTAPPQRKPLTEGKPWVCACGANLYIDAEGKPRSKT